MTFVKDYENTYKLVKVMYKIIVFFLEDGVFV